MRTEVLTLGLTGHTYRVASTPRFSRAKAYLQGLSAALALLSLLASGIHYWPRSLPIYVPRYGQQISFTEQGVRIYVPDLELIGELSQFDDRLYAHLMFDYYRGCKLLRNSSLLLISGNKFDRPGFHILVHLPSDLITGVTRLAELKAARLTSEVRFQWITHSELARYQQQTLLYLAPYGQPATCRLECLRDSELTSYLHRFIRFKSVTDPRVRRNDGTVSSPLNMPEASLLAADIVAVSRFYQIPVDLMLGIGAMENNFINVPGDFANTAWKARPEPGDIILGRARGRVLVRNDSLGVWQITREALRRAHRLYLSDKRDYLLLPQRLRPGRVLDINHVTPEVLTTYAGLLLRDLLDQFQGDVMQAAGAYNGTVRHPNLHYATGVQIVASYARQIIERTAGLNRLTAVSPAQPEVTIAALDRSASVLPSRN